MDRDDLLLPIRQSLIEDKVYCLRIVRYTPKPYDPYWMLGPIRKKKKRPNLIPIGTRPFPFERLFTRL